MEFFRISFPCTLFVFQSYRRILLMPASLRESCSVLLPCAHPWFFGNALYISALFIMHFITCVCAVINTSFHLSLAWASAVRILLCCDQKASFPEFTSEISSAQHCLCHQHHSLNIFRISFPWCPMFPVWHTVMEKGKCSAKILTVYIPPFPNLVVLYAIDALIYLFCDNVLTLICLQIRYISISMIPNTEMGCGSRSLFFTDWNLRFLSPPKGYDVWWATEIWHLGPQCIQPIPSDSQAVLHLQSLSIFYVNFRWSCYYLISTTLKLYMYVPT